LGLGAVCTFHYSLLFGVLAPTATYFLSLHDALPIWGFLPVSAVVGEAVRIAGLEQFLRGTCYIDGFDPCPVDRRRAHGTRFAAGVQQRTGEAARLQTFACLADRLNFRMGGGVVLRSHFIDAPADHLPVLHDDGGEGSAVTAAHVFDGHVDRLFQPVLVIHLDSSV